MGLLKAKLARYRSELLEPAKKGEKGDGFDVLKSGDARVALIGFPSVGKVVLWIILSLFFGFLKALTFARISPFLVYVVVNFNKNGK